MDLATFSDNCSSFTTSVLFTQDTWIMIIPISEAVISRIMTGKIVFIFIAKIARSAAFTRKAGVRPVFLTKVWHRKIACGAKLPVLNKDFDKSI
jgi:hypothetical protein